ncbi:calcium-binding protein, partial [Deltaproteobacteria bacterium TL4]
MKQASPDKIHNPHDKLFKTVFSDIDVQKSFSIILANTTSSDTHYHHLNPADVAISVVDIDVATFQISSISQNTTETGGTATFTLKLSSQPSTNVTIAIRSSDSTEGTVSPSSLTFTPNSWNINQTVTVTGVDDRVVDGNVDNDTTGIIVSAISGHTTESGGTASFTVKLTSKPTANVLIAVSSSDRTEGNVSPSSLTFTPDNWNLQTVTVTGVADTVPDNNQSYSVILAVSSSDNNYNHLNSHNLSVIN